VIQRLGIADRLEAIADGYSVERQTSPDVFLRGKPTRSDATAMLVVEDAASGEA